METTILNESKTEMDIELESLTIAEVLRTYLNNHGAKMAAWKRDHPTKNPVLHIEADNPKKVLKSAIAALEKDIDKVVNDFKKLK